MPQLDYGTVLRVMYPNLKFRGSGSSYSSYKAKAGYALPTKAELDGLQLPAASRLAKLRAQRDSDKLLVHKRNLGIDITVGSGIVTMPVSIENKLALCMSMQCSAEFTVIKLKTGFARLDAIEASAALRDVLEFESSLIVGKGV